MKVKRSLGGRALNGDDDPTLGWQWKLKLDNLSEGHNHLECFSIARADELQGIIVLTGPERCELAAHAGSMALRIEYLETAPWNRRDLMKNPKFSGVGAVLVAASALKSTELGHDGRLILDSIPAATAFYARMGFEPVRYPSRLPNTRYELTASEARRLLGD
ncbi:MAG: hypothetical protein H7144_11800 [Burkholderiales bacterium]|nr:hypothetical protein [Phycisphaerae bacterium]